MQSITGEEGKALRMGKDTVYHREEGKALKMGKDAIYHREEGKALGMGGCIPSWGGRYNIRSGRVALYPACTVRRQKAVSPGAWHAIPF